MNEEMAELNSNRYTLEKENELRISIGSQPVRVFLRRGLAEMYGTEMALNTEYAFPKNISIAIFTWHGCEVEVIGQPDAINIATDTTMILNVILHAFLEERRMRAENEGTLGPITLVVGPTDVGKSTLCRMLLNYAVRLGRKPLFFDLDVGQNSISIPGTVGVLNAEKPADIVTGFDVFDQSCNVYHFGYKSPGHNIALYFLLLKKLGRILHSGLCEKSRNIRSSGVIINTCGWVTHDGYDAITLAAMAFKINVLVVLEAEQLYLNLSRDMPSIVKVLYMPKLGGVVERSRVNRAQTRDSRIGEYFFGAHNNLSVHTFQVSFNDVEIYKIYLNSHEKEILSNNVSRSDVQITRVNLAQPFFLMNQVLGVSFADVFDDEEVMYTHVIGFVCVKRVNLSDNTITLLSPQPGPLPKKILMMGDIRLNSPHNLD